MWGRGDSAVGANVGAQIRRGAGMSAGMTVGGGSSSVRLIWLRKFVDRTMRSGFSGDFLGAVKNSFFFFSHFNLIILMQY